LQCQSEEKKCCNECRQKDPLPLHCCLLSYSCLGPGLINALYARPVSLRVSNSSDQIFRRGKQRICSLRRFLRKASTIIAPVIEKASYVHGFVRKPRKRLPTLRICFSNNAAASSGSLFLIASRIPSCSLMALFDPLKSGVSRFRKSVTTVIIVASTMTRIGFFEALAKIL
jgi:hypothetical protein